MNCPLLPVMPELDDELGLVADVPGLVDAALDPLDVVIEPFQAPTQPV
jgi:hypothetical protein